MVHWLLSTTRCKTFALIGRCLRRGVVILQRAVEILQRVVGWAVRLQRPAIQSDAMGSRACGRPKTALERIGPKPLLT